MPSREELCEMIASKEFLEYPICPYCKEITDLRGEFLPCCGEETPSTDEVEEWVRLVPIAIVRTEDIVGKKEGMKCPYCGGEGKPVEPLGHTEEGYIVVTYVCSKCRKFVGQEIRKGA